MLRNLVGPLGLVVCLAPTALVAAPHLPTQSGVSLQQFTSAGHVLGFGTEGYFVSNGTYALKVEFVGASPVAPKGEPGAAEAVAGDSMRSGAAPLGRVVYPGLWPGITGEYDAGPEGIARSTWHVSPGADPRSIRLRYNRPLRLTADGMLTLRTEAGVLTESAPVAWQASGGTRRPVAVAFALRGDAEVGFDVGAYDPAQPLVIDPTLVWNTFLGGSGTTDRGRRIAVDAGGNVYVVGQSSAGWGTPVRPHAVPAGTLDTFVFDVFVAKLDTQGTLLWHTFLGGSGGDAESGVGVDESGNLCVTGSSNATWGSPLRPYTGAFDAFAARLDTVAGTLVWNTFLGQAGGDSASGCAFDPSGNVYVVGTSDATWDSPIRGHAAGDDAFVAKLEADGALVWNTFFGGAGADGGRGIALDSSGTIFTSGLSDASWGSPVTPFAAMRDGFAARLDQNGALLWNTFLGGPGDDFAVRIRVDGSGSAYVVGPSDAAWGSPIRAYSAGIDAFAARLDSNGGLLWNTFLGSSAEDRGENIAVDGEGNVFVSGSSRATWGDPVRPHAVATTNAFVAHLDAGGTLIGNTFLGGQGEDVGAGIAVDATGGVYVSGPSGNSWGTPVRAFSGPAHMPEGFVAKLTTVSPVPDGPYLITDELPGYRFKIRITGDTAVAGKQETDCLGETLCVSGALAGRSELFVRIIGPRPNGFLWLNLVRFTTSQVEVWAEQIATGTVNYYNLPALPREGTELTGRVDKEAYLETERLAGEGGGGETIHGLPGAVIFTPSAFPDFRFTVKIFSGDTEQTARVETDCIDETVCVSGAVAGRSELFLRLIGPRPNGFLWVNLVRFTTSRVEVEVEQLSTGEIQSYVLDAVPRESNELPGLVDKEAFEP